MYKIRERKITFAKGGRKEGLERGRGRNEKKRGARTGNDGKGETLGEVECTGMGAGVVGKKTYVTKEKEKEVKVHGREKTGKGERAVEAGIEVMEYTGARRGGQKRMCPWITKKEGRGGSGFIPAEERRVSRARERGGNEVERT
jgi:hypothetical protein